MSGRGGGKEGGQVEIIRTDRMKRAKDDILNNLLRLHQRICEERDDAKEAIQLSKYLNKMLKKRSEEMIYSIKAMAGGAAGNVNARLQGGRKMDIEKIKKIIESFSDDDGEVTIHYKITFQKAHRIKASTYLYQKRAPGKVEKRIGQQ